MFKHPAPSSLSNHRRETVTNSRNRFQPSPVEDDVLAWDKIAGMDLGAVERRLETCQIPLDSSLSPPPAGLKSAVLNIFQACALK